MKNKILATTGFALAVALSGQASAQADLSSELNEQGSLLVYPLIDSLTSANDTIIDIANTGDRGVWVKCFIETHGPQDTALVKDDFKIYLTPHQKVWWNLSQGIGIDDNVPTNRFGFPAYSIPPYPFSKGFLYCFATDRNDGERNFNHLKGDALVYGDGKAFQYNAIPHQARNITKDNVLNLNGVEYTKGTSRIWFEGLPNQGRVNGQIVDGTLVLASIQGDYNQSVQTEFDVNYKCWNRKEQEFTRHRGSYLAFEQQNLSTDIGMDLFRIRSNAFTCYADTTLTGSGLAINSIFGQPGSRTPIWAVFHQSAGDLSWGTNVFHDNDNLYAADAVVVLPGGVVNQE
jgi:hypothetical protein